MPKYTRSHKTASKEMWKKFKKAYPEHSSITFKDFQAIIYTEAQLMADFMYETGDKLRLSHGLGDMCINRKRMRKFLNKETGEMEPSHWSIDWINTQKLGHYVYYKNYNSNGYYYKWAWFPDSAKVKFSHIWGFQIKRNHSDRLSSMLNSKDNRHQFMFKEWLK